MAFRQDNTTGYTGRQLAQLNAELAERLQGMDPNSDEYQQAEQNFSDEVAQRTSTTKSYTIEQKMSGTGSIHDLASDMWDRVIVFAPGCKYAVVLAAYYGGKGYTTHRTIEAARRESRRQREFSHAIIDTQGNYLSR